MFCIDGMCEISADWVYKVFSNVGEANDAFDSMTHARALIVETVEPNCFVWFRAWVPRRRWHQGALQNWVSIKLGATPRHSLEAVLEGPPSFR